MFSTIFGLSLIAHLTSDFVFQTDKIAANKRNINNKDGRHAIIAHISSVFIFNLIAFYFLLDGWWPLIGSAAITVVHIIIDILKNVLKGEKYNTLKFLIDQILHVAVISAAVYVVLLNGDQQKLSGIYYALKQLLLLPDWGRQSDKIVWTIVIALAFIWGSAYLIRFILKDSCLYVKTTCENSNTARAGKWIGILERLAIIIFVPINQWTAIGFLIAAKSLARHKRMDEEGYAEYFLIGTLLSLIIAMAGGLLLANIW